MPPDPTYELELVVRHLSDPDLVTLLILARRLQERQDETARTSTRRGERQPVAGNVNPPPVLVEKPDAVPQGSPALVVERDSPTGEHPNDPPDLQWAWVVAHVARTFGVQEADVRSSRRPRESRARHRAWAMLRERGLTLIEIGRVSGRDHSTVSVALARLRDEAT